MAGITIINPTNTFKFVRANNDFPTKEKPKKIQSKTNEQMNKWTNEQMNKWTYDNKGKQKDKTQ